MGYPTPLGRRTLRRVAGGTQHRGVADIERRTASGERHDVIDGQVAGWVRRTVVARTPVAVFATPGAEDASAESLPGLRAVKGVVAAAVGLPGVVSAATTGPARGDAAYRAELHRAGQPPTATRLTLVTLDCTPVDVGMSVSRGCAEVYSPAVLILR
jgi:hypothetical protein